MSTEPAIDDSIDAAADAVGTVWPLHSFVTANPLSGFEDRPFHEAVADAERVLGGDGYPSPDVFRAAWSDGRIDADVLRAELAAHGYEPDPQAALQGLAAEPVDAPSTDDPSATATDRVDAVLAKWLAAFLDQGRTGWPMPDREKGFYEAFRQVARHDDEIPDAASLADLPERPVDAIRAALEGHPFGDWQAVFEYQLSALPGWTGLIKQRAAEDDAWQSRYPITLAGYLAARLALVERFDAALAPDEWPEEAPEDGDDQAGGGDVPLPAVWLRAWEASYRDDLVTAVADASDTRAADGDADAGRPDAQLVFCIDTRSEVIRRHVEAAGDYETHGYAGFFGVPMRWNGYDSDVTVDACPPILEAEHHVADRPARGVADARGTSDRWRTTVDAVRSAGKRLKRNAATAFNYVEGAGPGYGAAMAARTLLPARVRDLQDTADDRTPDDHEVCEPTVEYTPESVRDLRTGLTLEERVKYAAAAFELMGWEQFARLVVFTGHAGETANNPFESSLDCGACAGNPGGPNARVLAAICNDDAVQAELRERGIDVPEDTLFLAGEHNTTTDEVELYASDVPESHAADVKGLRADLQTARAGAAAERAGDLAPDGDAADGVRETERRAADWAETRPEWGLAGNAGFVIGPRDLTDGLDLDGRSFLHSYDWRTDDDGDALEAILTGPLVVTQWINSQYYFATVDPPVYGSGSKVTQNPVGNIGVYQGNGGDLMTGLPLESVAAGVDDPYHQPLRLSTVVHAPVDRVTDALDACEDVAGLLDNGWLSLTVVDPTQDHRAFHYDGDLTWRPADTQPTPAPEVDPAPEPSAADD